MIDRPIKLRVYLTYRQALAILEQLTHSLEDYEASHIKPEHFKDYAEE